MTRISDIVVHETAAEMPEGQVSYHRWIAAQLIWEEKESGTSLRQIAELISKSHTHVRYMYNCWALVGRPYGVSDADADEGTLPPFNQIYMSEDVRGSRGEKPTPASVGSGERTGNRGGGYTENEEEDDPTASGMVRAIHRAATSLERSEALRSLLTDEDYEILDEAMNLLTGVLRL